jgi:hypothetical protein
VARSRPRITVGSSGRPRLGDETDLLIDRILPLLPRLATEISLYRRWQAIRAPLNSNRLDRDERALSRALICALIANHAATHSAERAAAHRSLQNLVRKAPDDQSRQARHEYTGSHAPGQLEALLALGHCRRLNANRISERLLGPLVRPILRMQKAQSIRGAEADPGFDHWIDQVRHRLSRMRQTLGLPEVGARADAAIGQVDVFLRNARDASGQ